VRHFGNGNGAMKLWLLKERSRCIFPYMQLVYHCKNYLVKMTTSAGLYCGFRVHWSIE